MEALLGSAASGVSPLALPWGSSACYTQPAGQRRGGKTTLVKREFLLLDEVLLWLKLNHSFKLYLSFS